MNVCTCTHTYIHHVPVCNVYMYSTHVPYIPGTCRALSDFDGDFAPEFGTEDSPAEICPDNSSLSPIALKIGLKVAGHLKIAGQCPASFEPMYV